MSYNIQTGTNYQLDTPQKIAILLEEWDIDILGTQELHTPQVKLFDNALLDYDWFGIGRDNGKELGETSVIFFRKEKYELLEQSTFWLSETPEKPGSKSWETSDTRIVTWGKFRIKSNDKVFFVFNTHYDHISSYARSESSKLLRIKMREIAGLSPIIITGDFNCSEGSTPYNLIVENHPDDLSIVNSEKVSITLPFGPSGSYNNFNDDNPTRRIDFIFTNQYMKTLSCGIINEKPNGEFISDHFPLYVNLHFNFPSAPTMPILNAIPGDNQVNLSWDKTSEDSTYESFLVEGNDFQGYKLYRSRDPEMKDAELIAGKWDIPLLRNPLLTSDKIDGIYGYTDYGIIDGFGYYLGHESGLQHHYTDSDVVNGQEYYYVLTAYDNGFSEIGSGFAPNESDFEFSFDDENHLIYNSRNTAVVKPKEPLNETVIPTVNTDENNISLGTAILSPAIFNPLKVKEKVTYKLTFSVDTLEHLELNERYRHSNDLLYVNNGFKIYRIDNDSLVYFENMSSYPANNILYDQIENFHYLNSSVPVVTEEFNGIQLSIKYASRTAEFSSVKSGWINGNSEMVVLPSYTESLYFPWQYEIIFTDDDEVYTGVTNKVKGIRSHDNKPIGPAALILNQNFNFYVINKSFPNPDGTYEKLDLVIYDVDMDGSFNRQIDQILVGNYVTLANQILWSGTVFALDFSNITDNLLMPKHGDSYLVDFERPFMASDEILINVDPEGDIINFVESFDIPEKFNLKQNYPNPFNPLTTIEFSIAQEGKYSLKVFNIIGQSVATLYNKEFSKGSYSTSFNSTGLSSGVYIYRLDGPAGSISKKMIMLK